MKYKTRYIKEHYVVKKIKKENYARLIKWCGDSSINICLEKALEVLEKPSQILVSNTGSDIGSRYGIKKSEKGLDKFMK
jgi:hypothetical protein